LEISVCKHRVEGNKNAKITEDAKIIRGKFFTATNLASLSRMYIKLLIAKVTGPWRLRIYLGSIVAHSPNTRNSARSFHIIPENFNLDEETNTQSKLILNKIYGR
jgi:hypothetical protein